MIAENTKTPNIMITGREKARVAIEREVGEEGRNGQNCGGAGHFMRSVVGGHFEYELVKREEGTASGVLLPNL
jgi:hypothetical protein